MSRDRKHIRLRGWDYSSEGIYFITICCFDRQNFFGEISDNKIQLSEIGHIASQFWLSIPSHFPQVRIDEFVIMPDHLHGILIMGNVGSCHGVSGEKPGSETYEGMSKTDSTRTRHGVSLQNDDGGNTRACHGMPLLQDHMNQFSKPLKGSLSVIINQYKSSVTRWCNAHGHQFKWQSRFYDQILTDEESLDSLRSYIHTNPLTWQTDVGKRSIRK